MTIDGDGLAKGSDDIYPASGDIGQLPGRCVEEMEDTEVSIGIQTKAPDEGSDTVSIQTYHEAKDADYKPYEGGFLLKPGRKAAKMESIIADIRVSPQMKLIRPILTSTKYIPYDDFVDPSSPLSTVGRNRVVKICPISHHRSPATGLFVLPALQSLIIKSPYAWWLPV